MKIKIGYINLGFKAFLLFAASFLPQSLKRSIYRLCGYRVGRGSKIGFCSLILCKDASIGRHVTINPFVVINTNRLDLCDYVWIGAFTLSYGNGSLILDKFAAVGSNALLNAEKDIVIGSHSFIGQYSNLYTHSVALPYTKGYPRKFASIEIGERVRISARTTILPGVSVANDTWVAAGSLVNKDLPAGVFAGGIPAAIIKQDVRELFDKIDRPELKRRVKEMVMDFLKFSGVAAKRLEHDGDVIYLEDSRTVISIDTISRLDKGREYIFIGFGDTDSSVFKGRQVSWFDFKNYTACLNTRFSKEMREFFWSHYGERIEIE